MREQSLWVEKYRPQSIDECILPPRLKDFFQAQVDKGEIQNMLLIGGAGTGKTTAAKALCRELGVDVLFINASESGGIDTIRVEIRSFASTISFVDGKVKCVILDEADYLSAAAQPALRAFIEEFSSNCLHRDTKIITLEYGSIEIGRIVDQEVTVRTSDGMWRKGFVRNYGEQDLYEYEFSKPNSNDKTYKNIVIATENHRWILEDGQVTDQLKLGDRLALAPRHKTFDPQGVIHGMIFGDGSGHRYYANSSTKHDIQGTKYPSIRICKTGIYKDEMIDWFNRIGNQPRYPEYCHGDPVFVLPFIPGIKDLPHTTDPDYIAGFIHGWFLADGNKTNATLDRFSITTIREDAVRWLKDYASFAGYYVSGHSISDRKDLTGRFANAKPVHQVVLNSVSRISLRNKRFWGREEVFCIEEPITQSFVLSNGILTGNCRFILTANYANRIIDPIKSRCAVIDFAMNKEEKAASILSFNKRAKSILEGEGIAFDKKDLAEVVMKYFPDYRKILNELQRHSHSGELKISALSGVSDEAIKQVMRFVKEKRFGEYRKWVAQNADIDFSTLVRAIFDRMGEFIESQDIPELVLILSEYDYKRAFVVDVEILTTAMLTQIMGSIKFK